MTLPRLLPAALALAALCPALVRADDAPAPGPRADTGMAAQPQGPLEPADVLDSPLARSVEFEDRHLRITLPAPYWKLVRSEELAPQPGAGGCGAGQRVDPKEVCRISNPDAPTQIVIVQGASGFLMRNEDDLEAYVDAFTGALRDQLRNAEVEVVPGQPFEQRPGVIVHRWEIKATHPARGGCTGPAAPATRARYIFTSYFIRPQGEDAIEYRLIAVAREEEFADLAPELRAILGGLAYTGPVAEEFFVPDAPQDKVPTPQQATEGLERKKSGWMMAVFLVVLVYIFLRGRRKQHPQGV
jgi:hypothetical protein